MYRVKPLKELINILLDSGFKPTANNTWESKEPYGSLDNSAFENCGKPPDDLEEWELDWLDIVVEYPCIMESERNGSLVYFFEEGHGVVLCTVDGHASGEIIKIKSIEDYVPFAEVKEYANGII